MEYVGKNTVSGKSISNALIIEAVKNHLDGNIRESLFKLSDIYPALKRTLGIKGNKDAEKAFRSAMRNNRTIETPAFTINIAPWESFNARIQKICEDANFPEDKMIIVVIPKVTAAQQETEETETAAQQETEETETAAQQETTRKGNRNKAR